MTDFQTKLTAAIAALVGPESLPSTTADRPAPEQRARQRIARRALERQANLERIVEMALTETPAEFNEETLAPDWLTLFFDYAQDVGNETAQLLWARVLAAYAANPDRVFKRTLVELHAMDQWEIDAFNEYCSFAFALESGWRFMVEETLTRQEIWGYVRGNDYTQHFIDIGLLSPEMSVIRSKSSRGIHIRYFEKEYELAGPHASEDGTSTDPSFGYRKFTPTGQQLARATRPKTYYGYARNLIKALNEERGIQFTLIEPKEPALPG